MTYFTQIHGRIWKASASCGTMFLVPACAVPRFVAAGEGTFRVSPALAVMRLQRVCDELRHHPELLARLLESFGTPSSFRPVPHVESVRMLLDYVGRGWVVVFRSPLPAVRPPEVAVRVSAGPQTSPQNRTASEQTRIASPPSGDIDAGPQVLGFGRIDPAGKLGLVKSINSKNPSRHGYAYEHGRNAADLRHAKDCPACQKYREPKIMGDVRDGKCGVDAILVDGTMVQRKSYRRLPGLRAAILKQVESDLRRYGNRANRAENWRGGRDGSALNGCIEFQIDLDRLLRRPAQPAMSAKTKAPIQYPIYTREYVAAWCEEFERELNAIFAKPLNGKIPTIAVRPLSAGERSCPLARAKGGAA